MKREWLILLAGLLMAGTLAAAAPEKPAPVLEVPLVTYYDYAPFTLAEAPADLTRELAHFLTKGSAGRYRFVPQFLPKGRLDYLLQKPAWQGVVAWLHPRFVHDESGSHYVWSASLMQETDLVVSHVDAPVEFDGPASLKGKRLGTILNQRYSDMEEMIAAGQLQRDDAVTQEANLRRLLLKRVDVVFVSRSTLSWLRERVEGFDDKLHIARRPRNQFSRHLMATPNLPPDLLNYVRSSAGALNGNPHWREVMKQYHVEALMPASGSPRLRHADKH